jgi:hypothetical protein
MTEDTGTPFTYHVPEGDGWSGPMTYAEAVASGPERTEAEWVRLEHLEATVGRTHEEATPMTESLVPEINAVLAEIRALGDNPDPTVYDEVMARKRALVEQLEPGFYDGADR